MPELMVKVPEESGVNWERFLQRAVELKVFELELKRSKGLQRVVMEYLASKSKLSKKQALKLGRLVNKGLSERYR
ncbi:MAG: hypothetical protein COZ04_02470 [Candidatus Aenigmarchaeota archaeon CG_4_10_14_3_um_filter_37_21]|nr:MAG: hypothetical protein COZ04_02470 [Candidatus Aenigmarchaeota archaeon CG_4_10_14_3_um_filter_37_21]